MRKKAFTLIELIVVLSIMTILIGISFPSVKAYTKFKEKKQLDHYAQLTLDFINNSKSICKIEDKSGIIKKFPSENALCLYFNDKSYRKINYPKEITLKDKYYEEHLEIRIKNSGSINQGFTVRVMNKKGECREITFNVYTDYGKVKE
ncbi:type II secretion system protein [Hathewaya massiliensis]|uniref:type II secretion system protein n=1 Tax=Hathewaya massiliensis TaxID=1964382 RepID=UPI0011591D25|nr:type II secretion system protein [Hathewaya massiliensis]